MYSLLKFCGIGLFCLFLAMPVSSADLVLTAPPRESPEEGKFLYKPLADHLSEITGMSIVYQHPGSWRSYERNMKNNNYDIIFDGPHFAAWRINTKRHRPLVKLKGSLLFVLVASSDFSGLTSPQSLVGRRICTLSSPNLGALTLFSMFPYPARQPEYIIVKGGFKAVAKSLEKGKCEAAILRHRFYKYKTTEAFKQNTHLVQKSLGLINQGITLSSKIDKKFDRKMIRSLSVTNSNNAIRKLMHRFGGDDGNFVKSTARDYENQNLLIDNSIFGWE